MTSRILSLLLVLASTACTGLTCPSFGSASGPLVSSFDATCSDGHAYAVDCARPNEGAAFACTCAVDGTATGRTFSAPATGIPSVDPEWQPAVAMVNPGCGWELDR